MSPAQCVARCDGFVKQGVRATSASIEKRAMEVDGPPGKWRFNGGKGRCFCEFGPDTATAADSSATYSHCLLSTVSLSDDVKAKAQDTLVKACAAKCDTWKSFSLFDVGWIVYGFDSYGDPDPQLTTDTRKVACRCSNAGAADPKVSAFKIV